MSREIVGGDEWQEKLVKLIPTEPLALFVSCMSFVASATGGTPKFKDTVVAAILAFVALIAIPLFLVMVKKVRNWMQIAVSMVAFLIWAANTSFDLLPWYMFGLGGEPGNVRLISGLLLIAFTAVSPFLVPPSEPQEPA